MQKEITQTWFFRQSPPEVWEYLTKPELIEQWLMKTDFQPIEGREFRFTFTAKPGRQYEGIVHCKVLEVKPFTKLSYSWQTDSAGGNKPVNSKVEWTLSPKENGTALHLVHNGFTVLEDLAAHESGWNSCHKQLAELFKQTDHANTNT